MMTRGQVKLPLDAAKIQYSE